MVSGTQENAAALMDEITTPVSLPTDLIAPKEPVAPGLHRESDASFFVSGKTGLQGPKTEDRALMARKGNFAVIDQLIDIPPASYKF